MQKTKKQAIMEMLKDHPDMAPKDIAPKIVAQGYEKCTPGEVSGVKSELKKAGLLKPGTNGEAPQRRATDPKVPPPALFDQPAINGEDSWAASESVWYALMTDTKALLDRFGNKDRLKKMIDAL